MPNTLGLDDDLDGVEVVAKLERIFDVKLSNKEVGRISTVGEFHDLLLTKIRPNDADRKCATAMAFYRIRVALRRLGYADKLNPAADLCVLERKGAKSLLVKLQADSGLHMPRAVPTRAVCLIALSVLVMMPVLAVSLRPNFASAFLGIMVGLIAAVGIFKYGDRGELPPHCRTLADMARTVAAMNYGRLVKLGARHRDEDIWDNLVEGLSGYELHKSEITRETFFLQSQFQKRSVI